MESLVEEAHEDCFGAVFASSEVKSAFLTRWQQREAMRRGVMDYIEQCDRERQRILEEIAEREKERNEGYATVRSDEVA